MENLKVKIAAYLSAALVYAESAGDYLTTLLNEVFAFADEISGLAGVAIVGAVHAWEKFKSSQKQ